MQDYELTILFSPDLMTNLEPALDKVRQIITDHGGKIIREENEGKKRLAYSIMEHEYAIYYYIELKLPKGAPLKISRALSVTDEVLRHLLVSVDTRRISQKAKSTATQTPTGIKS